LVLRFCSGEYKEYGLLGYDAAISNVLEELSASILRVKEQAQ
jgi:hypothetical protein